MNDKTLHHSEVTRLTGYHMCSLLRLVRQGVIKAKRDKFGLIRFTPDAVSLLIERAARNERLVAAKRRHQL